MAEPNDTPPVPPAARPANISLRGRAMADIPDILSAMNSHDTQERRRALQEAARRFTECRLARPHETGWANVLARTFFSYSHPANSPARLVWEAAIRGISVIGSADDGNLGALEEMLAAGRGLSVRATASLETTARIPSADSGDMNASCLVRVVAAGFAAVPPPDTPHGKYIMSLTGITRRRNEAAAAKLNQLLAPLVVGYERDILPATAAGNATAEHLTLAYLAKAAERFPDPEALAVFWADVLACPPKTAERLLADPDALNTAVHSKLQRLTPGRAEDYPAADEFFGAAAAAGALPCLLWDAEGDSDAAFALAQAVGWGARGVAVTPDKCWNVQDPGEKARRLASLAVLMQEAEKQGLPVLAGSAMRLPGEKFVDSFDAPEMAAYFRSFSDSAYLLHGHTTLRAALGFGVLGEWTDSHFGHDRAAANAFFTEAGKRALPGRAGHAAALRRLGPEAEPAAILDALAAG